jgi:FAD-dependent oxidoreductase family protein
MRSTLGTRAGQPPATTLLANLPGCFLFCLSSVLTPLSLGASPPTATPPTHQEQKTDIVIVGAGTGGVAAAIQAARLGAQVVLLEETDWIGGQMAAAGIATMDEGGAITFQSGIYAEFLQRMQAFYAARGKSVGTCYWKDTNHCYEPSAIQKILLEMLDDANHEGKGHIDLYRRETVLRVLGTDQTLSGVVTEDRIIHSKVVIDATEYGDILPLTHAAYRIGRFTSADPGKSCVQDINYTAIIKKYPDGVPAGLWMKEAPPGYDAVFITSMRRFLRSDGNPTGKDIPVNFEVHNRLRALPDSSNPKNYTASAPEGISRTAVNWFNDYPADTDIFDRAKRKAIVCAAKLRTLDFIYYIQHELNERDWSIANDEGYDTPYNREENSCPNIPQDFKGIEVNFPVMPYIRESRRIVGEYTLVGSDLRREAPWSDQKPMYDEDLVGINKNAIAVGDYNVYFHDCLAPSDLEPELDRESDMPNQFRKGPFQIPIETLIPQKVDGLLAAEKNISESRMANTATRLEPITILTGQAAGALAAIAVGENRAPRQVDPGEVQRALLDFNDGLALEEFMDLPRNVEAWKAAEYAVVHGWLSVSGPEFRPNETLTRAEAVEILASAFQLLPVKTELDRRWWTTSVDKATFSDVPVYSPSSAAVEALVTAHAIAACSVSADRVCPGDLETVGEFASSIAALRHSEYSSSGQPAFANEPSKPLTRILAAELLYAKLGLLAQ